MKTTIQWADAQLTEIRVDYDQVLISLQDSFGRSRLVRAKGYIRLEFDGVWDDAIVATGTYSQQDAIAQDAWASIRAVCGAPAGDRLTRAQFCHYMADVDDHID